MVNDQMAKATDEKKSTLPPPFPSGVRLPVYQAGYRVVGVDRPDDSSVRGEVDAGMLFYLVWGEAPAAPR